MAKNKKPVIDYDVIDNATDEEVKAFGIQYSRGDEEAIRAAELYIEAAKRGDASAIRLLKRLEQLAEKENAAFIKRLDEGDPDAAERLEQIKKSYEEGSLTPGERDFILRYGSPEEAGIVEMINVVTGDQTAIDAILEKLTPSKVKSVIPWYGMTPQEEAALTYTKEERAARRSGSPEEAEAATQARRNRAAHFLSGLTFLDFIKVVRSMTGGSYRTFAPTPAAENEDYSTISTTQFYRVASEVISLADFDEAARRINRRKKKKAAQSGTMKQGTLKALQVSERGGGLTLAVPAGIPLEKIAENGQKELDYVIGQIYKRDYDTEHDQIKAGVITISDNDLVKYKVCGTDNKTVNRRNFLNFLTFLSECKGAALTVTRGKKKKGEPEVTIEKLDIVPLFKRITIKRGGVYELVPNEQFNWKSALQYYTYLPLSAFTLSGRAYQTLNAILQKARLSAADRQNPAEVNITIMEVADLLRLPLDTNEAKKLIKTPIRNIVDEINGIVADISLSLEADEDANKAEYLTGSIKATFGGDLLQTFEKLKDQKEKNYKKQLAKHNRAVNAQKQREANAAAKAKAGKKKLPN